MKKIYQLKNLTFYEILKLFIQSYSILVAFFILISIIPLFIDVYWALITIVLKMQFVFFIGVFLSYILHEYLHVFFLRKIDGEGIVEIKFSFAKVSIFPKIILMPNEIIKVATLPVIIVALIGLSLIFVGSLTEQFFLRVTGWIYVLHLINLVPPLGDGRMLLKAFLNKKDFERR